MKCQQIHIVPFDMGFSFSLVEHSKKYSKDKFIKYLSESHQKKWRIDTLNNKYCCIVNISSNVQCRIFEYGIAVFVIKNLQVEMDKDFKETFKDYIACQIYYEKKLAQQIILKTNMNESQDMLMLMRDIWDFRKKKLRPFSACDSYKHSGLSYVLTIYHITDDIIGNELQMNLLMNPQILSGILDKTKWQSIKCEIANYELLEYSIEIYGEKSKIVASWSSVGVLGENSKEAIDKVVDYEVELQSCWFLYDALADNLKNAQLSNLDLQRCKSIATNVFLEISEYLSANTSTNEKNAMKIIESTSGLKIIKNKSEQMLKNMIDIEETKTSITHSTNGIITEILLALFALIQIYEPIKNLINGEFTKTDGVVATILILALAICSFFIIKKEK